MAQVNLRSKLTSFHDANWLAVKEWAEEEKRKSVQRLIAAATQQESDKQRGALEILTKLLNTEKDVGSNA